MILQYGIAKNKTQFLHQLLQVLMVGLTLGMMRTVIPVLASTEFGVPRQSFLLLSTFVIAFGIVKGVMNFIAGTLAERWGRRRVLLLGWLVAVPIPFMLWAAPDWSWIVAATVLLGVNQGLTWSVSQAAKLDLTLADERGLTIGLNEFAGYAGVALAGVLTAYLANWLGARGALLLFGLVLISAALLLASLCIRETLPWAKAEAQAQRDSSLGNAAALSAFQVFALMSWRDRRMFALCQAGLVEKFVDALVWIFYPIFLSQRGLSLPDTAWVISVYGFIWGGSQLFAGRLSDRIGRHKLNVAGMWLCGLGVMLMVLLTGVGWWAFSAALSGLGMALLYPNLSAAVADLARAEWRASAMGIYRFWRDFGYALGALAIGLTASITGLVENAFFLVAAAMFISGLLLALLGEETHPRLQAVT
jgi:MFS family permease